MRNLSSIFLSLNMLIFFMIFYLCSERVFGVEGMSEGDVSVVAKINVGEDYGVKFSLRNLTKEPLKFYEGALSRDSITLVLVQDGSFGQILDEMSVFDNPSPGFFVVNPEEEYSSEINLDRIFPSLRSELKKHSVILFWSVKIRSVEKNICPSRFGGYLVISEKVRNSRTPINRKNKAKNRR